MNTLLGYWRTLRQYLATAKGQHDFFDDLRALLLIALTIALVWGFCRFVL